MPDFDEIIEQQAAEPLAAAGDAGSATNRSLKELQDARDREAARTAAASANPRGGRTSAWNMTSIGRARTEGTG